MQRNKFFDWCLSYLARIAGVISPFRLVRLLYYRIYLFGAIKQNPVTHLKSTNEIHCHKARVYYFFVNKDGGQLEKASCLDNSKFLLHAAYEELNLIQIVTYIHPLQLMIKTLRAQMGSKTLTRVPLMKLHLQVRLKNCFAVTLAASVVRKIIEQTIFRYL